MDRHVEVPRYVGLTDVELLQESGEEFTWIKGVGGRRGRLAALAWTGEGARPHMFRSRPHMVYLCLYIFCFHSAFELGQVLPEEFAAVDHAAAAHVKQVHRQHSVFIVIPEDISIITLCGGNALALLPLPDCRTQVSLAGRALVFLCRGRLLHALL